MNNNNDITSLLLGMTLFFYQNKITFNIEMNENKENSITETIKDNDRIVTFMLNDVNDENLYKMLSDFYDNIKLTL